MLKSGLVGIGSYSARGKQYIVALRPYREGLILHQLRYAAEVKDWKEVPLPDLPESKEAELAMASMLIEQLTAPVFTPGKYKDEVQARMRELIDRKIDGQEIDTAPASVPAGQIVDLMAALKASLGPAASPAASASVPSEPSSELPARLPAKSAAKMSSRPSKQKAV